MNAKGIEYRDLSTEEAVDLLKEACMEQLDGQDHKVIMREGKVYKTIDLYRDPDSVGYFLSIAKPKEGGVTDVVKLYVDYKKGN